MSEISTTRVGMEGAEELRDLSSRPDVLPNNTDQETGGGRAQSLLPCDGGPVAWRLLISCFVFEALLWGKHFKMQCLCQKKKSAPALDTSYSHHLRFSAVLWRLPELLQSAPAIRWPSLYIRGRDHRFWYIVYWCTNRHTFHQAVPEIP